MNGILVIVAAAGCMQQSSTGPEGVDADVSDPVPTLDGEAISDLTVDTIMGSTVKLSFTQVADVHGQPADYELRYQQDKLESWEDAHPVARGTCAGRLRGTDVGRPYECTVEDLSPGTTYELQATALNRDETSGVNGTLSNIAAATPGQEQGEVITRHSFTNPVEDGWAEPLGAFSHGTENGDGYGQANYTPDLCQGCAPINTWKIFDAEQEEVTVRFRWKVSPNMDHNSGSTNKKILFLNTPNLANPVIVGTKGAGAFYIALQRTAEQPGGARQMEGGSWLPGNEYVLVWYIKANSVDANGDSNPDGIASLYVDGTRVIHATDVRFRGNDSPVSGTHWEPDDGISEVKWNPTWPSGDPPAENMWERIYDIVVWHGQI